MFFLISLVLFPIISFYCFLKFYWYEYWNRRGVPGPPPTLFLGNMTDSLLFKKNQGEIFSDIYREFSNVPFVGIFKGSTPTLVIRDPDLIKEVTIKSFTNFHDNDFDVSIKADPLFGRNPFVATGADWKSARTHLTPCFTSGKVRTLYSLLEASCKQLVHFINNQQEAFNGEGLEGKNLCSKYTLNNVGNCAFGIDPKTFEDPNAEFTQIANRFLTPSGRSSLIMFLATLLPIINKFYSIRFTPKDVEDKIIAMVQETLKYREEHNIIRNDFLHMMNVLRKDSKDKSFAEIDIAAHAAGFFVDGYETSSIVMHFILYELANNPEAQSKLRQELEETFKQTDGQLSYEIIQQMPYLAAVFNESIRLYPPLLALPRRCKKPYKYVPKHGDGITKQVTFEPGTPVMIPVYGLHHDPKYFENPEAFLPERFLGENKEKLVKYTFLPFGEGPRNCLGQRFGWFQVKMGVAYVVKNFEMTVNEKTKTPLTFDPVYFLAMPVGGLWINFKKISS